MTIQPNKKFLWGIFSFGRQQKQVHSSLFSLRTGRKLLLCCLVTKYKSLWREEERRCTDFYDA